MTMTTMETTELQPTDSNLPAERATNTNDHTPQDAVATQKEHSEDTKPPAEKETNTNESSTLSDVKKETNTNESSTLSDVKMPATDVETQQEQAELKTLSGEKSTESTPSDSNISENDNGKSKKKIKDVGPALVGKNVETPFGVGLVLEYRQLDEVYQVKLTNKNNYSPMAILYTKDAPKKVKTKQEEMDELNGAYLALERMRRMNLEMECFEAGVHGENYADQCMACLMTQYEESSRFPRLQNLYDSASSAIASVNLADGTATSSESNSTSFPRIRNLAESTRTAIASESNSLSRFPRIQGLVNSATSSEPANAAQPSFPRIRSLWGSSNASKSEQPANNPEPPKPEPPKKTEPPQKTKVLPRIQKLLDERQKASASPCLICASPSCSAHSSANFRKEGITLCLSCEKLFELDFIVDCVSTPDAAERSKHIDHMVDCYDRCLLLLKFSTQYADQIALSLEAQKEQENKIGLGSSGVGAFSGVLGIAAAATILTPVGPPLLVASLFFGGSATAVQAGNEARNYFSEPNKLADRVIALHGMVLSLLRVTSTLRDAMLRDHIRTDVFEADATPLSEQAKKKLEENKTGVMAGANVGRSITLGGAAARMGGAATMEAGAVAGAEAGAMAGARGATVFSRAGTAAARTVRFARFAGGALSAAVLVMEANAIQSTLKDIHEGSPCQKANKVKEIAKEIEEDQLPSTSALDEECQAYLQALASRPMAMEEFAVVATNAPADLSLFPEAECKPAPSNGDMCAPGVVIVDGEASAVTAVPAESQSQSHVSSVGSSSLFQRIQRHQQRQGLQSERTDEVVAVVLEDNQTRETELSLVL